MTLYIILGIVAIILLYLFATYNSIVRNMNTKVEMFPSNIVAKVFKFQLSKMFEADAKEKDNVTVDL